MPKFMDYHRTLPSAEIGQKVATAIKAGRPDQFGTKPLNVFMGKSEAWCLTEAPNAEAVYKSHESLGARLSTGDITEVSIVG